MRRFVQFGILVTVILFLPAWAWAQGSSLTGVVRDTSGAVLPGVTVEAASPALIERVRSAASDANGQYRIVDLRPGTYTVTFTLSGFSTVKREGLVLPADFTATLNADLQVGTLAETITVTGASPLVDVTSMKTQQRVDRELLTSIPAAQGAHALMLLMPGVQPTGGPAGGAPPNVQLSPGMVVFGNRGGRPNEGQVQTDGLGVGAPIDGGGNSQTGQLGTTEEVVFTTTPGLGEAEGSGPILNMIPRTGSNVFRQRGYWSGMGSFMQANNYSPEFAKAGLLLPQTNKYLWDSNISSGGPIKQDRLWYFGNLRYQNSATTVPGAWFNRNAGDKTKWLVDPDRTTQVVNHALYSDSSHVFDPSVRLTIQATARNKLSFFYDEGPRFGTDPPNYVNGASPETGGVQRGNRTPLTQVRWTQTTSNRLLLEGGLSRLSISWQTRERYDNDRSLIRVTEQCSAGCPANGNVPANYAYRAQNWNVNYMGSYRYNGAATYVTGSHTVKVGMQGASYWAQAQAMGNDQRLEYRVNNGVPNQFTQRIWGVNTDHVVRFLAFYGQDQWRIGRLTLQGALRYDHPWSLAPEQQIGPDRFLPTPLVFPKAQIVRGYNDITPRFGLSYDLFGTGKTALKFSMGRYLDTVAAGTNTTYGSLTPGAVIPLSTSRTWIDANANWIPDCDLTNQAAQDLRATGGDSCGAGSFQTFGKNVPTLRADDKILHGWGIRPADWDIRASLQHELFPRIGVSVDYIRRWLVNFPVTINAATAAADFTQFSVVAPQDPRLPGGGGYTIPGLYDVVPAKFGQVDNVRKFGPDVGNVSQVYNGAEIGMTVRLQGGGQLQAGTAFGQRVTDYCGAKQNQPSLTGLIAVSTEIPAMGVLNPWCHDAPGIDARYTALGTYIIPKIGVQVSGTFRSDAGRILRADWTIPAAQVTQWLGRAPSGGVPNITVNLLRPGEQRADRTNEVDLRVGKILQFGKNRANVGVDVFNLLNANTVLSPTFPFTPGGNWLTPTNGWLIARTAKLTAQIDF